MSRSPLANRPDIIKDVNTLREVQDRFRSAEIKQEWVFRGLADGCEGLETTLWKVAHEFGISNGKIPELEVKLILEFLRRYHLYGIEPPPEHGDTLDCLALMRHHGAPIRLLDFTFSFLVAAYFALERKTKGSPKIWAINKTWLTKETKKIMQREKLYSCFKEYARYRDGKAFRKIFMKMKRQLCFVSAVSSFRMNQRLTAQQGIFLCPGDVSKSFDENLKTMPGWRQNVIAVPVEPTARPILLEYLFRANLNSATLFPGLDGFATSLWAKVTILKKLQSMEDSNPGSRSKDNLDILTLARR